MVGDKKSTFFDSEKLEALNILEALTYSKFFFEAKRFLLLR